MKKKLESKVFFTGFQKDVDEWIEALDIFILPSLTEGTPMSLLEAMAKGVPVVASAVGGVPHVIESMKNGILVAPGNAKEIKNAVYFLFNNYDERKRLSAAGRDIINKRYCLKDWVEKIEYEYICLAAKKSSRFRNVFSKN